MYVNETRLRVRYAETDQMGIVHHSNYYVWFEVGRTEFFNQTGMSYGNIEKQGILLPLIESSCSYKEPARYEDEIIVRTWIEKLGAVRITFCYEIIREKDGKLLASGKTVHAFVNADLKPVNLKKVNESVFETLEKLYLQ
ncbi:MAG: acyl-CoA thioesterase [Clostridiaceae bacterium]|nr:acyl-CoA thioesterase [Clostridiaceae bacterium]